MPTAAVNDITYHFEIAGQSALDATTPLVLLHGFTGSGTNWHELANRLARTMPIITIDLPGHGQTDAPATPERYHMAPSAHDVITILEQITPGSFNLLGYSMGGRLALYMAVTYPQLVNKLILESASPGLVDPAARADRVRSDEALADRIEREGIPAFVDYWERIPLFASQASLSSATRQRLRDQRLRNRPHGLANSLRGMGTGVQAALWDQLPTLAVPTLLLSGEFDEKFCAIADQMATLLPNARHQTIPQAGHTIHLEQPAAYEAAVIAFLRGQ